MERKRIGNIVEYPALYPNMTAFENLEVHRTIINGIFLKFAKLTNCSKYSNAVHEILWILDVYF